MRMDSARQLKDWLKNKEKQEGIPANTLINFYMMERLLERIAISRFRDMLIIKGGFLIASMIGVDLRSTLDLDTTIRGMSIDEKTIRGVMDEIMTIEIDDHVTFRLVNLGIIHEEGQYENFRVTMEAAFFTIRVLIKIDMTTGDWIIPSEIVYAYRLIFEDRIISVKAYNC